MLFQKYSFFSGATQNTAFMKRVHAPSSLNAGGVQHLQGGEGKGKDVVKRWGCTISQTQERPERSATPISRRAYPAPRLVHTLTTRSFSPSAAEGRLWRNFARTEPPLPWVAMTLPQITFFGVEREPLVTYATRLPM